MKPKKKKFDDHMAMSLEEVKAVLKYFNLPEGLFWAWMGGQTCPLVDGKLAYFWYDLNRYIENHTHGRPLIFD